MAGTTYFSKAAEAARRARPLLRRELRFSVAPPYGRWGTAGNKSPVKTLVAALQAHSTRRDFRATRGVGRESWLNMVKISRLILPQFREISGKNENQRDKATTNHDENASKARAKAHGGE
jgi:hypothetical protein